MFSFHEKVKDCAKLLRMFIADIAVGLKARYSEQKDWFAHLALESETNRSLSYINYPPTYWLPSGKQPHNYGKIHHFSWENHLYTINGPSIPWLC